MKNLLFLVFLIMFSFILVAPEAAKAQYYDGQQIMSATPVTKDLTISATSKRMGGKAPIPWAVSYQTDSTAGQSKYIIDVLESIDGTYYTLIPGIGDTVTTTDVSDHGYIRGITNSLQLSGNYLQVRIRGVDSVGTSSCNVWLKIFESRFIE